MIHFDESDYIVTHSNGHRQCVPAEVFESMYEEYTDQVISIKQPAIELFGIDE